MFSFLRRIPSIESPTIGFLDLTAGRNSRELAEDKMAISSLFSSSSESSTDPPRCNVLFVYCCIGAAGRIEGSSLSLRELIRDSRAAVVVVASEKSAAAYIAAGKNEKYGKANLAMTLYRKGAVFPDFFRRLFTEMQRGVSMPVAWLKLAPQVPGSEHPDCPDTIFACEVGQLVFK